MSLPDVASLARLTDAQCAALRARFAEAHYDEAVLATASDLDDSGYEAIRIPLAHAVLEDRLDPASRLALLLTFAGTLRADHAREALGPEVFQALRDAGVLVPSDSARDTVRSNFRVTPMADLWILSDHFAAGADMVMLPGATTGRAVSFMPPAIAGAALDLGCGPGAFALVAARRGARPALGTDISERAVAMARFNARLNGVDAEFRVGNLCDPVADLRFALVVAQPPYVIQPDDCEAMTYLHGGAMGDDLALRFVAAVAPVLAPGGRALIGFDSASRPGVTPLDLVTSALGDASGVDTLVLVTSGPTLDQQKVSYATLESRDFGPAYGTALRRYHRHLERLGVKEFHHLLVVLRKHADDAARPPWSVAIPVRSLLGVDGGAVDVAFACVDLAVADDATLAGAAVQVCPAMLWVDERPAPNPKLRPTRAFRFGEGTLGQHRSLPEHHFALLAFVSSAPTVEDGIRGFAQAMRADPAAVRDEALQYIRSELVAGVLEPREATDDDAPAT